MCDVCSGKIKDVEKWEKEQSEKHGFYAHLVPDEEDSLYFNAHTHGFVSSWNHSDFQIVLPIDANIIMTIFHRLAERVKNGDKFEAGTRVEGVIKNYYVQFETAHESGRDVLRVVLPDPNGHLPGDLEVEEMFQGQMYALGGIRQEGERS